MLVLLGLEHGSRAATATSARLVLPVVTVRPGDTFLAGLELTMKPGWHTYWRNGGDSGAPTTLEWQLPAGIAAGEPRWPAPERYAEQDLVTFVYHGKVTLLIPISVAPTAPVGPVELTAAVKWLECEKLCLPGKGTVRAQFRVGITAEPSADATTLREAVNRLPPPAAEGTVEARWEGSANGDLRPLLIRWRSPPAVGSVTPDFFPDSDPAYEVQTATQVLTAEDGWVSLRKQVRRLEGDWPGEIRGLLVQVDARQLPKVAVEATLALQGGADAGSALGSAPGSPGSTSSSPGGAVPARVASISLVRALGLGFLGGMILNIMPCVLPVIALKILGFVRQGGSRPAEIRKLGLIYGLGVWFSFLVLAGVVIGVRQAAGFAGWGMQFGNPVFLVAMTTLVLLVSLSLFGVFEINLSGKGMDAAGELASKEGAPGAFFNGMLSVALATPCTAPFLAPALGYAFAAPASTIALVFSAVAFGLAAPYVILSWQPAWLKFLPKPGAWMERFKVAMGFPMLATALWLYTLTAAHFPGGGALWLGLFLVGLALSVWVWGEFVQRGRQHQTAAMVVAVLLAGCAYGLTLEHELHWRQPRAAAAMDAHRATTAVAGGIPWEPWSREAVDRARKAGRPVFVDFTADWCLTCQLNERSSINIPETRERLRTLNAVPLKGDYTLLPPAMTEELQRYGRAGVPLVLVYPSDPAREPQVLPAFLTPGIVLEALDAAVK